MLLLHLLVTSSLIDVLYFWNIRHILYHVLSKADYIYESSLFKNMKVKIYLNRTTVMSVVLCCCESLSLTLRQQQTCCLRIGC